MTKKKTNKKPSKMVVKQKRVSLLNIKPKKILNKKNAIEFADYLYREGSDDKRFFCEYTKMCSGLLVEKSKKKPLSCILGEAYLWFINDNLSLPIIEDEIKNHFEEIDMFNEKSGEYKEYLFTDNEEFISYFLAKNSTYKDIRKLQYKIGDLIQINDNILLDDDPMYYLERAKDVKEYWMKNIVPLLK